MNKNVPFIWRVNYRNDVTPREKVLEIAHEQVSRIFAEKPPAAMMSIHH